MKLVGYNVQYGIGLDQKYDLARIAASLEGADIIALQEVTRGFFRNGGADMVAGLEALFPDHFSAYHAPVDLLTGFIEKDGRPVPQRLQFGNMILSRYPILSVRGHLLPRSLSYDRLNLQRAALEAVIGTPDGPLRVYSVHLDHISPDERITQIEALKRLLFDVPQQGTAVTGASELGMPDSPAPEDAVMLGDFNLRPGSPEHDALFGRPDAFYGRSLRRSHPADALARLGKCLPDSYSWEGEHPEHPRMLLDYAALTPSLAPRLKDAFIDNAARGSDHFPLWIELA